MYKTSIGALRDKKLSCLGHRGHGGQARHGSSVLNGVARPQRPQRAKRPPLAPISMPALGQKPTYWTRSTASPQLTTSSALISIAADIVNPSDSKVFLLITRRKRVGCSNGRSAGFAPFRDLVDHVEHANSKLLWHWCEPRRGLQGVVRIGQT